MPMALKLNLETRIFSVTQIPLACRVCKARFIVALRELKRTGPRCPKCGATEAQESRASALKRAVDYLIETLALGERPAIELITKAKRLRISMITLRRASTELEICKRKRGGPFGGDPRWYWSLPKDGQRFRIGHLMQRKRLNRIDEGDWKEVLECFTAQQRQRYEEILRERPRRLRTDPEYQASAVEAVLLEETDEG